MGLVIGLFRIVFGLFFKIVRFTGLYWFMLPFAVGISYELITGGNGFNDPIIGFICDKVLFYLAFVLTPLTTAQNLVRVYKKDNTFNIYRWIWAKITGAKQKVGTQATSKGNTIGAKKIHGVVFGKEKDKYYMKDEQEKGSILVVGGSRSGKTSGIAIPTLKSWKGGIFAIDIKGELYETTAQDRNIDFVKRFNPCDSTACSYNPFASLEKARNITQEVKNIALAIIPPTNDGNQKFWVESAQDFLSGAILFYYNGFDLNFSETMIQIKTIPAKETVALIMESDEEKAKAKMSQFVGMDDKTLGGIFAEVSRNIDIFATDDDLIRALNGEGDCITPQDIEDGYDIYCCIEEHLIDQWRPLMTMICNQFFKFFEQRDLNNDKPILFFIDEFPRLGRIESIIGGLSTLAGRNIHLTLIIQSKSQLSAIYGKDNANVITDNCNYKAILKATEPETQKWCAELVGKFDKEKLSSGYNADMIGIGKGTSTGRTTEYRYIIEPSEFGYLAEKGKLVLLAPSGYKVLDKIKWWEDKNFQN